MKKKWTQKEENYLIENFKTEDVYILMDVLNRKRNSINNKAKKLGLHKIVIIVTQNHNLTILTLELTGKRKISLVLISG